MNRILLPLLIALAVGGCRSHSVRITQSDLENEQKGETHSNLRMPNGTMVPVTVVRSGSGETIDLSIRAAGEELEQEEYRITSTEFDLVRADTDVFAPPVPLLKFPASPGAKWDWKGVANEGTAQRTATADVVNTLDQITISGERMPCEKVVVHLSIDSGSPVKAKRDLTFWFVENHGLVKREFGASSARLPAEAPQ